jgi:hypothetical protein
MGWWTQNRDGVSFASDDSEEMLWGDGPADVMDSALAAIVEAFEQAQGRRPTKAEVRAGLEFSLGTEGEEV